MSVLTMDMMGYHDSMSKGKIEAVKMVKLADFCGVPVETMRGWRKHRAEHFPTVKPKVLFPMEGKSNQPWYVPLETALLLARARVNGFKKFPDEMVEEIQT
jgi:gamma-glutamylcysteine synthetase